MSEYGASRDSEKDAPFGFGRASFFIVGFSLLRMRGERTINTCYDGELLFWRLLGKRLRINIVFADLGPQRACVQSKRLAAPSGPQFPLAFVMANLICSMMMASSVGKASPFAEES